MLDSVGREYVLMFNQPTKACHLDIRPGDDPLECVLDYGRSDMCLYAGEIACREQCRWWLEPETKDASSGGTNERQTPFEPRATDTAGSEPAAYAD